MSDDFKKNGRWGPLFAFPNIVVHATLLPNGNVLHWGRRENVLVAPQKDNVINNLDEHFTKSFLWIPAPGDPIKIEKGIGQLGESKPIDGVNQPFYTPKGQTTKQQVNLFCSGHSLLSSGNLLAVGGHISDAHGVEQASIFDWIKSKWIPQPIMNKGRWYPSAITLPDGRVLCLSGCDGLNSRGEYDPNNNNVPEMFAETSGSTPWTEVADAFQTTNTQLMLDLYPRIHINPTNGSVFMVGPKPDSWVLDFKEDKGTAKGVVIQDQKGVFGRWRNAGTSRDAGARDYAPSVMYAPGQIMYIGGGAEKIQASDVTEFIDLTQPNPQWDRKRTIKMKNPRKQFNATILADGTVLVTGGTSGPGFNDLGLAVRKAELLDPAASPMEWKEVAPETKSRCYHGIALLLPDGRVLSAGSGEAGGIPVDECHKEGQLYEPPYLFRGPRPTISTVQPAVNYGEKFPVNVGSDDKITKVTWMRLGSVTHCRNMSQSFMTLTVDEPKIPKAGSKLTVIAPDNSNLSPPGHYMLFVLNEAGVPSIAQIIQIPKPPAPAPVTAGKGITSARIAETVQHTATSTRIQSDLGEHNEKIIAEQNQPHVVVGLTPLCPYGLGACWGGAYDGLRAVKDIDVVRPVPNNTDSLAFVYLKQDILPDIDVWRSEFEKVANKSYTMRGIEMTISGAVTKKQAGADEQLTLAGTSTRPSLILTPFQASSQLKWDLAQSIAKPITNAEADAYKGLATALANHPAGVTVQVTGTLQKHDADKFSLDVREFEIL